MKNFKPNGFVSIQLSIFSTIIAITVLTAFASLISAKAQARDQQRLTDVAQIQKALQIYFTENGYYPDGTNVTSLSSLGNYLSYWPQAPRADGSCSVTSNQYTYSQISSGSDFSLSFCLGSRLNGLSAGPHQISIKGIK